MYSIAAQRYLSLSKQYADPIHTVHIDSNKTQNITHVSNTNELNSLTSLSVRIQNTTDFQGQGSEIWTNIE